MMPLLSLNSPNCIIVCICGEERGGGIEQELDDETGTEIEDELAARAGIASNI
jgi:hypothetical protein